MGKVIKAAATYTLSVFALGFVLGTLRVLFLEDRLGAAGAVYVELPVMIAASVIACLWVLRRFQVSPRAGSRAAMGLVSFAVLMVAELWVSMTFFDRTLAAHLAHYTMPSAWPGLAAQVLFAALPVFLIPVTRAV